MQVGGVAAHLGGGGAGEGQEEAQEVAAGRALWAEEVVRAGWGRGRGWRREVGGAGLVGRVRSRCVLVVVVGEGGHQEVAGHGGGRGLALQGRGRGRGWRLELQLALGAGAVDEAQAPAETVHPLAHIIQGDGEAQRAAAATRGPQADGGREDQRAPVPLLGGLGGCWEGIGAQRGHREAPRDPAAAFAFAVEQNHGGLLLIPAGAAVTAAAAASGRTRV